MEQERQGPTTSRRDLARHRFLPQVSPQPGQLDESGFEAALEEDPDAALGLLSELVRATDRELRARARRLAGRIVLDRARHGAVTPRGVARIRTVPADRPGADLDVDGSLDALAAARGERRPVGLDELTGRAWGRPGLAVCLLVDRSGSMAGERLAAAALAAAACSWRAPEEHAVLAFAGSVLAVRGLREWRPPAAVVDDVLSLRGKGTTDLRAALVAARVQLERSRAARKLTILLSDCRVSDGADPAPAARDLDELVILGPADDGDECERFAREVGARLALLDGPAAVPDALERLLG
jgi:Mg-chelatase subunit ChlD